MKLDDILAIASPVLLFVLGVAIATSPIWWDSATLLFNARHRKQRRVLYLVLCESIQAGEWHKARFSIYSHKTLHMELTDETWPYGVQPYLPHHFKLFTMRQRKHLAKLLEAESPTNHKPTELEDTLLAIAPRYNDPTKGGTT